MYMKQLTIILSLTFFTLACREDDAISQAFRLDEGTYEGVFYRSSPNARWAAADVTLTFEDGRFSGSSDQDKYPAICEGTYQLVESNRVIFSNDCIWTADFDWRFILDDEFQVTKRNQKLVITREYEGEVVDTYELKLE